MKTGLSRVERLKQGIDFCKAAGIPAVHAHFGFIPEDPKDILYMEFIETMKPIGEYALKQGIDIYFETGQETPVTLLQGYSGYWNGKSFCKLRHGKSCDVWEGKSTRWIESDGKVC